MADGWICPNCKRGKSPEAKTCFCTNPSKEVIQKDESTGAKGELSGSPLNTIDEDAGRCCQKTLLKIGSAEIPWACQCGLEYESEMVGPIRHWKIKPRVVVHR